MQWGTTFSHKQITELKLEIPNALERLINLRFDVIRIATYWDINQPNLETYDFSQVDQILGICEQNNQKVVLTLGCKSPRWPEFHLPSWIDISHSGFEQYLCEYIKSCVSHFRSYSCIQAWQLENEPLDPSGVHRRVIPIDTLQQELKIIKALDTRQILVTIWGNDLIGADTILALSKLSDIVGIDLYYKQFISRIFGLNLYRGPTQNDSELITLLKLSGKKIWISELQAEPWEHNHKTYSRKITVSFNPQQFKDNLDRVLNWPVDTILLWGFEYWYWQSIQGYNIYFDILDQYRLSS